MTTDLSPENGVTPKVAESEFTITAHMDGFPVAIKFTGTAKRLRAAIEALKAAGATPPPVRFFGSGKPPSKPTTQPAYNDAGDALCPTHQKKLYWMKPKDNWPGKWKCPCKSDGTPGEVINERGYCDLRFELPAPEAKPTNSLRDEWDEIDRSATGRRGRDLKEDLL